MIDLPPRQQEALRLIRQFIDNWGYPPSVRELAEVLGVSSTAAKQHLEALDKKGMIRRTPRIARAVCVTNEGIHACESCMESESGDN